MIRATGGLAFADISIRSSWYVSRARPNASSRDMTPRFLPSGSMIRSSGAVMAVFILGTVARILLRKSVDCQRKFGTLRGMPVMFGGFKPAPCEECGMDAVPHRIEKFSLEIDSAFDPFFRPIDGMMRRLTPLVDGLVDRVGPPLASVFFAVGLAVKVAEPDEHFSETAQVMWAEAQERGIEMYEVRPLGIPCRIFVAKYKGKAFAFEGLPRLARKQKSLQWVDDKAEVKKRFEKAGFPVPRGGSAATEAEALQIFETLQKPVITKPQEGSGGRHTSVHIMNEQELRQ